MKNPEELMGRDGMSYNKYVDLLNQKQSIEEDLNSAVNRARRAVDILEFNPKLGIMYYDIFDENSEEDVDESFKEVTRLGYHVVSVKDCGIKTMVMVSKDPDWFENYRKRQNS